MASVSKFHLVDKSGNPLNQRVQDVTEKLERHFRTFESKIGDPAVISDCVEQTAMKVAVKDETQEGPIEKLSGYFRRSFANAIKTKLRNGNHHTIKEAPMSDEVLAIRANTTSLDSAESIELKILLGQTLQHLDKDKQNLLILAANGYTAKEIAKARGMTESNVNTSLHRARVEARKVLDAKPLATQHRRYSHTNGD